MSVIKFILSIVDITIIPHFLLYDYFKVHFFRLTPTYFQKHTTEKINPEDNIESPLTELGLLDYLYTKNGIRYYKKVMIKESLLPDMIALAIILKCSESKREIKISTILSGDKSLGKAFNLDIVRIINILYRLEKKGFIKVIRTAGLDIIQIMTDMNYYDCIENYYKLLD